MSATLDEAAKLKEYSSRAVPTKEQTESYIDNTAQGIVNQITSHGELWMGGTITRSTSGTTGSWTTTAATYLSDPTSLKLAVAESEIKSLKAEIDIIKGITNQLFDMISKITTDKEDELDRIREIIKA